MESWSGVERLRPQFEAFCLDYPHRDVNVINAENVSGDHLLNCKNCLDCFEVTGPAEDLYHVYLAVSGIKDIYSSCMCGHRGELELGDPQRGHRLPRRMLRLGRLQHQQA